MMAYKVIDIVAGCSELYPVIKPVLAFEMDIYAMLQTIVTRSIYNGHSWFGYRHFTSSYFV